jgi:hypothetical protein
VDELDRLLLKAREASPIDRIGVRDAIAAHGLSAIDRLEPWLMDRDLGRFAAVTIEHAALTPETVLSAKAVLRAGRRRAPDVVVEYIADALERLNRRSRTGGRGSGGEGEGASQAPDSKEIFLDLRDLLVARARQRRLISYNETGLTRNVVGPLLDDLNRSEHESGRPLLSSIVVHKGTAMPGDGFFICACELGRCDKAADHAHFAHAEQERVFSYWEHHSPANSRASTDAN